MEHIIERIIEIEGQRWRVLPLVLEAGPKQSDARHFARVRFEPLPPSSWTPRETWLRLEEDVPAGSVLDQYTDEELVEAFLVAGEVRPGDGD